MTRETRSRRTRWILLLSCGLSAVIFLAIPAVMYFQRLASLPPKVMGDWVLTDFRDRDGQGTRVRFLPNGELEGDPVWASRWAFDRGQIHVRSWRKDGNSVVERWIADSSAYGWLGSGQEYVLVPTFSEDAHTMTLAFPGKEPHAVLHRPGGSGAKKD